MASIMPKEFSSPVERVAHRLLADAQERPGLIRRGLTAAPVPAERRAAVPSAEFGPFPDMALLSDPALDIRQYLEDLVSIAITSSQQAEDVAVMARQAARKSRFHMMAVGCIGVLGLIIGVAGFAVASSSNVRLAAVSEEVRTLSSLERQVLDQLDESTVRAAAAAECCNEDATQRAGGAHTAPASPPVLAPMQLVWNPPVRNAEPWPDSRPPAPRKVATTRSRQQPPVNPPFFVSLQRSLHSLFR